MNVHHIAEMTEINQNILPNIVNKYSVVNGGWEWLR
jgi:hypothetical protein